MSADAQTIPEDIREAAIRAVQAAREDFLLAKVSDNQANLRSVAIECVEAAIIAERARCTEICSDHISVLRKIFQNDTARALEQVRAEIRKGL